MKYLSVCAGIEAATVAWHPLGWKAAAFSEIEPFPCAVLKHHYPNVPLHGDFTTIKGNEYGTIELLVGGTPCQDFSVAGLRAGLAGERGNLTLEFIRLVERTRPRWVVWENVPGVLSLERGRTFATFLYGLRHCGYGFAYRVLDAQYFGVPQRRRRVFVIGYLGDWRPPAAVLFERKSLCGDITPRREKRKDIAPTISARTKGGGGLGTDFDCDGGLIALQEIGKRTGKSTEDKRAGIGISNEGDPMFTLQAGAQHGVACFNLRGREGGSMPEMDNIASLRASSGGSSRSYVSTSSVRRLTPRECERLQGFSDDYTLVSIRGKHVADGLRYKALGNSMAVPVMRWIGERINLIEELI